MAEALDIQAELRQRRNQPVADRTLTVKAYAVEWCDTYQGRTRRGLREGTRAEYRRTIERDVVPFGTMRLADITARDLKRYIAAIGRRGVSPDTVRLAYAPLRLMLTTAHEDGVIATNPAAGVRPIVARPDAEPIEQTRARALTADEIERLLDALPPRWRLLVRLLAETGLTVSEAIALRWSDVDLGRRRVLVRRRLYRGRMGSTEVALRPARRPDHGGARPRSLAGQEAGGRGGGRRPRCSPHSPGGYLMAENVRRAFLAAAAKAGVEDASLHTLRHTCATKLSRRGLNAKQVQLWLGHHSPAFTLSTYVHLLSDDLPDSPFEAAWDTPRDTSPAETSREPDAAEAVETADLHAVSS